MNIIESIKNIDPDRISNRPILDIAAGFWEEDRYSSFKTCYRSMRVIDDIVDDCKIISTGIPKEEKTHYSREIKSWIKSIQDKNLCDSVQEELIVTISKYKIPLWPWIKFSELNPSAIEIQKRINKIISKFRSY